MRVVRTDYEARANRRPGRAADPTIGRDFNFPPCGQVSHWTCSSRNAAFRSNSPGFGRELLITTIARSPELPGEGRSDIPKRPPVVRSHGHHHEGNDDEEVANCLQGRANAELRS